MCRILSFTHQVSVKVTEQRLPVFDGECNAWDVGSRYRRQREQGREKRIEASIMVSYT